ncbi:MAG: type III-A CRISPR-associated RAMP protein Csm4 [Nitrospirae bacterium]|nr:type III-A CRISPR-associated RAMP protein Csm4 [Nitrospirota bacterium]
MKYLIELNFKSGVHFGSDVAGYGVEQVQGYAHSDTIFSALINTLASIRGIFEDKKWISGLLDSNGDDIVNVPFKVSSFGFVNSEAKENSEPTYMYYIPKPLTLPINITNEGEMRTYSKDFRKRKFISIDTYLKWIKGEPLDIKSILDTELQSFWVEQPKTQHLTDSLTSASQIYRTGLVFYLDTVKPFFIVDIDETIFTLDDFKKILNNLKYTGLGGRKTSGCGSFDFSEKDWFCLNVDDTNDHMKINQHFDKNKESAREVFKNIFAINSNSQYLFSTYFPSDINNEEPLAYSLVLRKGWFFSTSSYFQLKRQSCFMFGEGSVFESKMNGALADVTPKGFTEHKIYRCGIPFTLPFCGAK